MQQAGRAVAHITRILTRIPFEDETLTSLVSVVCDSTRAATFSLAWVLWKIRRQNTTLTKLNLFKNRVGDAPAPLPSQKL